MKIPSIMAAGINNALEGSRSFLKNIKTHAMFKTF
jgi:hypothetical protein